MTVINFKNFKNSPFTYKIKKPRYRYVNKRVMPAGDMTICEELDLFEGLSYEFNDEFNFIRANDCVLWNDEVFRGGRTYALLPKKMKPYLVEDKGSYDNFVVMGNVACDVFSGEVGGFSAVNYIQTTVLLPECFEIYTKFKVSSSASNQIVMSNQTTGASPIRSDGLVLKAWSNSGSGGSFALASDVEYYVKGVSDGTTFYLYGLCDESGSFEELKNSQDWVLSWSCPVEYMFRLNAENLLTFGRNTTTYSNQYLNGKIYLKETEISGGGEVLWLPKGEKILSAEGCLDGVDDVSFRKCYAAFVKPEGELLLSEKDEDKPEYVWANAVTVPEHSPLRHYLPTYESYGKITYDLGLAASGFSGDNYIKFGKENFVGTGDFEWTVRGSFYSSSSVSNVLLHAQSDDGYEHLFMTDTSSCLGSWHNGAMRGFKKLESGNRYWFRLRNIAGKNMLYFLLDNDKKYTLKTLPEPACWENALVIDFGVGLPADFFVGRHYNLGISNQYWTGDLELETLSFAKINTNTGEKQVFLKAFSDEADEITPDSGKDFYPTNSWSVQDGLYLSGGGLSGFSNSVSRMITTDFKLDTGTSAFFEMPVNFALQAHFKTPQTWRTDVNSECVMTFSKWNDIAEFGYIKSGAKMVPFVGWNSEEIATTTELAEDTEYWFRIVNHGTAVDDNDSVWCYFQVSTDGVNWINELELAPKTERAQSQNTLLLGGRADYTAGYVSGVIYPEGTFVEVNSVKAWQMAKQV